ncbi:MAG: FAD-dependent oxidoreductase [Candidatus Hadarchaeales archaeon]
MTRIVVVGSQSAGFTAASFARMTCRGAEVTIVERRPYGLYHPCGIPLAIEGVVKPRDLVHGSPPPGVEIICGAETTGIDTGSRVLRLREQESGREREIPYDSLILATGGIPVRLRIPGSDLDGVHTVRTIEDCEAILKGVSGARRAAVIGGGAIGVEVALSLRRRGLQVVLFEQMPYVLPTVLDEDMAEVVENRLEEAGVEVACGSRVSEIRGERSVRAVISGEREHPAEIVIMAVGVVPNSELARDSGIKIGRTGGIRVDKRMRTSAHDVFAAGECAETVNAVTGEPTTSFLASTAAGMGRVAGINAAGGKATFGGVLNSTLIRADSILIGSTGFTSSAAEQRSIKTVSTRIRVADRPSYVPGSASVMVKLTAEAGRGNLVGGQVIGRSGVAEMIDLLSFAIVRRAGPEELREMEHCYMPWATDVLSPLQVAADALMRKLR